MRGERLWEENENGRSGHESGVDVEIENERDETWIDEMYVVVEIE